jgi:hypothetical protein
MLSGERSEAWSVARTGSRDVQRMGGVDPYGLRGHWICPLDGRNGYRRVHVLLGREGWDINFKKVYRIYRELGMQLRHKTSKRRVKAKLRDDRAVAVGPNDVWPCSGGGRSRHCQCRPQRRGACWQIGRTFRS